MTAAPSHDEWLSAEWLEADGLGGFASGTVGGVRTRRYHALLLAATTPPTGRVVLVNGLEVWLETAAGSYALSSQRYAPDVVHPGRPDPDRRASAPSPGRSWTFRTEDGTRGQPGDHRLPRPRRGRGALAPALAARRRARLIGAPAALRPRLPFACTTRTAASTSPPRSPARACSGGPIRACRRSRRSPTAATATTRSGTATSSTMPSARAASTSSRTWPRPASSAGR